MHLTWWQPVVAALVVYAATSDANSTLRKARLLRATVDNDGGTYRHSNAFANERRSYRRTASWSLPIGTVLVLGFVVSGMSTGWTGNDVVIMPIALWIVIDGSVGWACLHILGPPAPRA